MAMRKPASPTFEQAPLVPVAALRTTPAALTSTECTSHARHWAELRSRLISGCDAPDALQHELLVVKLPIERGERGPDRGQPPGFGAPLRQDVEHLAEEPAQLGALFASAGSVACSRGSPARAPHANPGSLLHPILVADQTGMRAAT